MDVNIKKMIQSFKESSQALSESKNYSAIVKNGQNPHSFLICCCDSRVDPTVLFQNNPGEVFELRTIANIIPPFRDIKGSTVTATIEFVLQNLELDNIIILGHSDCAGVSALCKMEGKAQNNIEEWLEPMLNSKKIELDSTPKKIKSYNDQQCLKTLRQSKENLMTYPNAAEIIKEKGIDVHTWFYDMKHKDLYSLEENSFVCISD